jgi:hypothetical protein
MQPLPNNINRKTFNTIDKLNGQLDMLFHFLYHLPNYALSLDKNRLIIGSNNRFLTDNDFAEPG